MRRPESLSENWKQAGRGIDLGRTARAATAMAAVLALGMPAATVRAADEPASEPDLSRLSRLQELSLEQLLHAEVTSASKRPERLWESSSAAFLIQNEDIARSGARSIAEALRLAPGVNVASMHANKTVVAIRGFSDLYTDKLLVLVDGRSVYSPITSGVFWEALDYPLEDVERIEVVRGPGGTLWGANAVNGVVNIITKSSKDTLGGWVSGGYGTEAQGFGEARYGARLGENSTFRTYAKYRNEDGFDDLNDAWHFWQAGFRFDWEKEANSLSVHGDVHRGDYNQVVQVPGYYAPYLTPTFEEFDDFGGNLQATFLHHFSEESELQLQAYYDAQRRSELVLQSEQDVFDVDFQHRFPLPLNQSFMYGAGYRYQPDHFENQNPFYDYLPAERHTQLVSAFVQDEIGLVKDRLKLTLGTKVEHNDYTGWETQPSARLGWTPTQKQTLWASVSRAVQVPGRNINDLQSKLTPLPPIDVNGLPMFVRGSGSTDIDAQELIGYELGYRIQPADAVSFDVATFYNDYDKFISGNFGAPFFEAEPYPHLILPAIAGSVGSGKSYGGEIAVNWRVTDWWRLAATYSYLKLELDNATGVQGLFEEGKNPQNQASLRSSMDLPAHLLLDIWGRFVDRLPTLNVSSYFDLDVRLAWRPKPNLEISVVGQNLVQDERFEFSRTLIDVNTPVPVPRGVYAQLSLKF